jgi:exodeoxyribonuclease VII small subunit
MTTRKPTAAADTADLGFEAAFRELEEAIAALEQGELSLDDSLAFYERGAALAERCATLLSAAELRIRQVDGEGRDAGKLEL